MAEDNIPTVEKPNPWLARLPIMLTEFVLIAFGVVLGLMLNEWREDASQKAFVEKNIDAIHSELERNYEILEKLREYRLKLYPDILAVIEGKKGPADIEFQGLRPPPLQSAAYEVALQSAVFTDLDTSTSAQIVKIYQSIEAIENVHQIYGNALPTAILETENIDKKMPEFFRTSFMDFLFAEEESMKLIAEYYGKDEITPWYTIIEHGYEYEIPENTE